MADSALDSQANAATPVSGEVVEQRLEPVIRDLPAPKQAEIRQTINALLMTFIGHGGQQRLDPETVRILTTSVDKDNENKFRYLSQKQTDNAAHQVRQHDLAMTRHRDTFTILKPCAFSAIFLVLGLVASGTAFIAYGREAVGSSIISGTMGLFFGFLGGFGISKTFGQD